MAPQQQQNFWDWIQSFDTPGRGVDHQSAPPFPPFYGGFPFGGPAPHGPPGHHGPHHPPPPHGPHPPHHPHGPPPHHGPHQPHGPPPPPYAHWGYGPWGPGDMNEDNDEAYTPPSDNDTAAPKEKQDTERQASDDTMQEDITDPAEVVPEEEPRRGRHHGRGRGCGHRRGGRWGRGGRGGFFAGPRSHHHPGQPPFDFGGMLRGWANHPFFQNLREQADNFRPNTDHENSFTPPVDVFNTERAFVLHVALPGAKKEHIGVSWDADRSVLNIAGVVHRPGDEEFLQTMASSERRVGMFERDVTLPPVGTETTQRDEIDAAGITAKMEDGVLVITVPKIERDWTEIRKVDIE